MLPEDPSLDDATDVWNGAPQRDDPSNARSSNGTAAPPASLDEDTRRARLANAARAISVKLAAVDAARAATEPQVPGSRSQPADSASRVVARRKPTSVVAARQPTARVEPSPQPRRVPTSSVAQLTAHVNASEATELDGMAGRSSAPDPLDVPVRELRAQANATRSSAAAIAAAGEPRAEGTDEAWRRLRTEPTRSTPARPRPPARESSAAVTPPQTVHVEVDEALAAESSASASSSNGRAVRSEPEAPIDQVTRPTQAASASPPSAAATATTERSLAALELSVTQMVAELLRQEIEQPEAGEPDVRPTSTMIGDTESSPENTSRVSAPPAATRGGTTLRSQIETEDPPAVLSTVEDEAPGHSDTRTATAGGSMSDRTWRRPPGDEPGASRDAADQRRAPSADDLRARMNRATSEAARRSSPGSETAPARRKPSIDVEAEWERALARARSREVNPPLSKTRSSAYPVQPPAAASGPAPRAATQLGQPAYPGYGAEPGYDAPGAAYGEEAWDAAEAAPIASGQYAVPTGRTAAFDARAVVAQAYDRPGYAPQGHEPARAQSGYAQAGGGLGDYEQPGYAQTGYEQAGYDQAGYAQAGHAQGGYDQSGYAQSGYDQAGHAQSGYDQAGHAQSGYDQSGYAQGGYDQAGYAQAGYEQAGYAQSGYEQGGYAPAGHEDYEGAAEQTGQHAGAPDAAAQPQEAGEAEALGAQMYELLERARASEERAVASESRAIAAERQLAQQSHFAAPSLVVSDDALTQRKGGSSSWLAWAIAGICAGAGLWVYFGNYAPLQERLAAQAKLTQDQATANAEGVSALRAQFARERQELEQKLSAAERSAQEAQARVAEPPAEAPKPKHGSSSASADTADGDEPKELSAAQQERREARLAAREARREEREAKKAERESEREAKKEERARARAERSGASDDDSKDEAPARPSPKPSAAPADHGGGDDPLGGLDDL